MIDWVKEAYRGTLWPYLILVSAAGYGLAYESHSFWHYFAWPCLAVAIFAMSTTARKLKRKATR